MSEKDRTHGPRELARLTGVSTDTLRHYERRGLLARPHCTAAGYRRYPTDAVARVQLIQRALVIGFSLTDLARVLRQRDRGGAPCQSVRTMVGARLASLERQLEDLTGLRAELSSLLCEWDGRLAQTTEGSRANLLDTLAGRSGIEKLRARRGRIS